MIAGVAFAGFAAFVNVVMLNDLSLIRIALRALRLRNFARGPTEKPPASNCAEEYKRILSERHGSHTFANVTWPGFSFSSGVKR